MQPQRSQFDLAKLPPRFQSKIAVTDKGCWAWTGAKTSAGYSQIKMDGSAQYGHRKVYELLIGPIGDGLHIDHLCCNPSCVNPAHLEPVTCRVNILRGNGMSRINEEKTHCVNGHEFTPENTIWVQGGRRCRECANRRQRERYRRRHGIALDAPKPWERTHCPQGHPYDEENTAIYGGKRACRACIRKRAAQHYWAKKNGGK